MGECECECECECVCMCVCVCVCACFCRLSRVDMFNALLLSVSHPTMSTDTVEEAVRDDEVKT